jgi:hypothetical protein
LPPYDKEDVKREIASGKIGAVTLDTSIFDRLGRNLNSQPLISLRQFRHGPTKLVLSEVVVGELKSHLASEAGQAKQELEGKLRGIGKHWHLDVDVDAAEALLGIDGKPGDFADAFFAQFQEAVDPTIIGVGAVDSGDLLKRYLNGDAPFGAKEAKKHEFPDALAVISLESWVRDAKTIMLVVSNDGGWREFCNKSEHLVCMDDLAAALNLFNEDAGVIVKRVLAMLKSGHAVELHSAIDVSLESFFEGAEVDVDADSHDHYEGDYIEHSVNSWHIYDEDQADVIFSDEETLTFSIPVYSDTNFAISFRFSAWDGLDRDYVRLGSRTVNISKEIEVIMTITVSRNIDPEPAVEEISTTPYRIHIDMGHIDPFDC